jgi:membrane carboxypeptidase/penicillin-binding protein
MLAILAKPLPPDRITRPTATLRPIARGRLGGRDYATSQFNRAIRARRRPGSAFKPFVYAAALSPLDGRPRFTPATVVDDSPLAIPTARGPWRPRNDEDRYEGPVTVRRALEHSLNAWFVGYSSRLLAVVWVGFDDGRPHALSGAQAALPIWADFMGPAPETYPAPAFAVRPGVTVADLDPTTGLALVLRHDHAAELGQVHQARGGRDQEGEHRDGDGLPGADSQAHPTGDSGGACCGGCAR